MEKGKRLKLYSEKDYSEVIDFPVELVGRDGVVRRYSYADSIRIYERRIQSAHLRYGDREIIEAEIRHCSKRLEQIKRSWKARIHSSERRFIEGRPGPRDRELYERGRHFLTVYMDKRLFSFALRPELGQPNLVNLEETPEYQAFYVNWTIFHPGTLLYVYRLKDIAAGRPDPYNSYLEVLRLSEGSPDTEKLIHHERQEDFAFVLTGPRSEAILKANEASRAILNDISSSQEVERSAELANLEEELEYQVAPADGPYREGIQDLKRGDYESAIAHFKEVLDENPFNKEAYWALGTLGDLLKRWDDIEPHIVMSLKYFPNEGRAYYYHGLMRYRRGELAEAQRNFQRAVRLDADHSRAYGFLASIQASRGNWGAARRTLRKGLGAFPRDQSLLSLTAIVDLCSRRSWRFRAAAAGMLLFGLPMVVLAGGAIGLPILALLFLAMLFYWLRFRNETRELLKQWTSPS